MDEKIFFFVPATGRLLEQARAEVQLRADGKLPSAKMRRGFNVLLQQPVTKN